MKPTLNARAFGPNGEAVAKLIERASSLTAGEAVRLHSAWRAAHPRWYSSWDAAWDTAWVHVGRAAWNAASQAAGVYSVGAGNLAGGAALALAIQDQISEEHFNFLYGPWASVMEAS
jgi:hypothetical protein